jgi:DNA-binding NtrC family response regulator
MGGDLVSLRVLVVAEVPSRRELWQQATTMASVPIEYVAEDAAGAVAALRKGDVDICVVDTALADSDREAVTEAARAARSAPLLFVTVARGAPRPANVDAALARPTKPEDARRLVDICVRGKIPTNVLIVDDSGTMRGIVRKILTASRFALNVHETSEGIAALEQIGSGRFGLVFLDHNMPGLNGIETLSEIKRISPGVSVVMMTSTIDNIVADRARLVGALAFLKKPFYPADIDVVLERHFGLHATAD